MFVIDEILVDEQIAHTRFACDLASCHGACCTLEGGKGAPLEDEEVDEIQRALPVVLPLLSQRNQNIIMQYGAVEGSTGEFTTRCIDEKDCVFVFYEGIIARCALEKAYFEKKTSWRKPVSCHLFPIRVNKTGGMRVRYERIDECSSAIEHGVEHNIPLSGFVKDALVKKFGEEWYQKFLSACQTLQSDHHA